MPAASNNITFSNEVHMAGFYTVVQHIPAYPTDQHKDWPVSIRGGCYQNEYRETLRRQHCPGSVRSTSDFAGTIPARNTWQGLAAPCRRRRRAPYVASMHAQAWHWRAQVSSQPQPGPQATARSAVVSVGRQGDIIMSNVPPYYSLNRKASRSLLFAKFPLQNLLKM